MKVFKCFLLGLLRFICFIIFFVTTPIWIFIVIGGGSNWLQELSNKIIPNSLQEKL